MNLNEVGESVAAQDISDITVDNDKVAEVNEFVDIPVDGLFYVDIPVDGLYIGMEFESEDLALKSILNWTEKSLCPLIKTRRTPSLRESEGKTKGGRDLEWPHGRRRKQGANEERPKQSIKYTKCPAGITISEYANTGKWVITKAALQHFANPISKKNFYSHEHTKRLNKEDKEFVKELQKARALTKNIASF